LKELGWTSAQVGELLRAAPDAQTDLVARDQLWGVRTPACDWPEPPSALDDALHHAAVCMFLGQNAAGWRAAVRHALDGRLYAHLVSFLSFIESTFRWMEAHPEQMFEVPAWAQPRLDELIADEPGLRPHLQPHSTTESHSWAHPLHQPGGVERFRMVFDESPLGIMICSPDFRILEANAAVCQLLGYREHELVGLTFADITHPDDVELGVELGIKLFAGTIPNFKIEKRYVKKNGDFTWVHLTGTLVRDRDGNPETGIGIIQCIDDRKNAEAKLNEYTRRLERSNAELDEFTRVVSHDLKEPIRTLRGYARVLTSHLRDEDELSPTAVSCLASVEASCEQIHELVDGLLEYARVDDAGMRATETSLRVSAAEASRRLTSVIEETGATITVHDLPVVTGDPLLLTQVFQNLIENAIKFRADAAPRVDICAEHHRDGWHIRVCDNGIGIADADAKRIFGIFERVQPRDGEGGAGIGLAVCRKIVERHGGAIWAEANPSGGSSFVFTLPVAP
jgi:PAS domain S-box-containing protein